MAVRAFAAVSAVILFAHRKKQRARNADRDGYTGGKNAQKHTDAQGHGGRPKPNFKPKPKRPRPEN